MKQKKIPKKIEFTTTTVLQTDAWANYVLAVIIPIEKRRNLNPFGGDIVEVIIKPEQDKSDVAKDR